MSFAVDTTYLSGFSQTGSDAYGDSGSGTFIPQIWSGKLLVKFYAATVFGSIANTDYEGEIKGMGESVIIRSTPDIVIRDYEIGDTLTNQRPTAPKVQLDIDKGKYFSFVLDDVEETQSDIALLDDWGNDASEQMQIAIDTQILGTIYADVSADNKGATAGVKSNSYNLGTTAAPVILTKANILDYIVDMGSVLDEQNIPHNGRWLVLPVWACGLIKKSDLKDASVSGDGTSMLRNGRLGMIDRFEIYMSNNVAAIGGGSNVWQILAGHKAGLTFASQMTNMETLRGETRFGTIVRGLNVYGYKVIKATALTLLEAQRG